MRRKQDHLPRGVRWAVRLLRLFGSVIILPVLCLIPIGLLPAVLASKSPFVTDVLWMVFCLPLGLGGGMRVMGTCIELSHDQSIIDSDPGLEWRNFAVACLCVLALGFGLGAIVALVQLVVALGNKSSDMGFHAVILVLHLGIVIGLYLGSRHLGKWFNRTRKGQGDEP